MSSVPRPSIDSREYLAIDRGADHKSEYFDGEMFAKAGGTYVHAKLISRISHLLQSRLGDRPCDVVTSDLRVQVAYTNAFTYPDIVVTCEEPVFSDGAHDTLLNPTVIMEVLSKSTDSWDRGGKFQHYRRIPTLRDNILVSQDQWLVEHRVRQADDSVGPEHLRFADRAWLLTEHEGTTAVLRLESVGCELSLADIYAGVQVAPPPG